ncbi:MMPL family transporter [Paenibacillus tritici]|uniref:MMPL family transporter n=1 Tax=Paenibacillus tritici TaxID=1873425 RepID=UPI001BAB0ECC|nr:MMPL family transporter [Paenibacillus tritici]QUL53438.1 MMPL family transporter [Paenibacillus tritici]
MATLLYRLAHWSVRNSKKVIIGGVGVLLALAVLALAMGPAFSDDLSMPGLKSQKAIEVLNKEFANPQAKVTGGQTRMVIKAPKQETLSSEDSKVVIQKTLKEIAVDTEVQSVVGPDENHSLSADKTIAYIDVTYKSPAGEVTDKSREHITDVAENMRFSGWQAELSGEAFVQMKILGPSEVIGVVIAFVVLAITFSSFLLGALPIVTAAVGLGIGLLGMMIGSNMIEIQSVALSLAAMLGLAVGIDYALFIVSRFRQQLVEGYERSESIAIANATAGSSVVFAAVTVIIGLAGLSVVQIPFLTAMGLSGAFVVFVTMLSSVIMIPALLSVFGNRISASSGNKWLKPRKRVNHKDNRWGQVVTRKPLIMVISGVILLSTIALPFLHIELGLPDDGQKPTEKTERRAYDLISEGYGPGFHSPLVVLARADGEGDFLKNVSNVVKEIGTLPNVGSMSPAIPGPSGKLALINIIPATGPHDVKTKELVQSIRDQTPEILKKNHVELMVTGTTAVNIDISQKLNEALPKFCMVIVGLAFVLLMVVFRSLLVPLKAVLGFILSLAATLGFSVFVIQDGHMGSLFGFYGTGTVLNFMPIIVVGILFGLAMDYEVFLVSRMREEYKKTGDAKKAVLAGMGHSGSVVTAAGLIMISVFTGFMLAEDPIIKSMGFALAFGILFDAFVVRMLIVPATMTLMGKSAWYLPKWLDRILPNLDIEGEAVMEKLEHSDSGVEKKKSLQLSPKQN